MKKNYKKLVFAFLVILTLIGTGLYVYTMQGLMRGKEGRAVMQYIMECEGTTITEYVMEDRKEYFSIRCEESPGQYVSL